MALTQEEHLEERRLRPGRGREQPRQAAPARPKRPRGFRRATQAKKDVAAGSSEVRKKITASVNRTERHGSQQASSAGTVEKKARAVKDQAERKLIHAEQTASQRVKQAGGAIAKEVSTVKVAVKEKADAVAKSIKSVTVQAKTKAAGVRTDAARDAAAAKRAAAATKNAPADNPK